MRLYIIILLFSENRLYNEICVKNSCNEFLTFSHFTFHYLLLFLLESPDKLERLGLPLDNPGPSGSCSNILQIPGKLILRFFILNYLLWFLLESPDKLQRLGSPQDNPGPSGYFHSSTILQSPGK